MQDRQACIQQLLIGTVLVQATASMHAVQRIVSYLEDARYLDALTDTLTFQLLTFNSRLRAFATWELALDRKADGRFYGSARLRHCFEAALNTSDTASLHRFYTDMLLHGLTCLHILWLADDTLLIRSMRLRQVVRNTTHCSAAPALQAGGNGATAGLEMTVLLQLSSSAWLLASWRLLRAFTSAHSGLVHELLECIALALLWAQCCSQCTAA